MAQAFRRLGSGVTVVDVGPALAQDDPECVEILLAQLEREGVVIHTGVAVSRIAHAIGHVGVAITRDGKEEMIGGSHLLVAAGRSPVTDGLNLDAAGVRYDKSGIAVGRNLKTSNARVYAIGEPPFTHAANHQAGLVIRNALFRQPVRVEADTMPHAIFTDPELAQTGLTEVQARARGRNIHVLRRPYHDSDRAQAERQTHGHIKIIADAKGRILGATFVGPHAGESISAWTLAIAQGLTLRSFTDLIVPYPTLFEIGKRAAVDFYLPRLTQPLLRRIIGWVRIFG